MSSPRTLSVQVESVDESGSIHHFNVDNLTYLQVIEGELTVLGTMTLFGIPAAIALILFMVSEWYIAIIVAFGAWYVLFSVLEPENEVRIGTVNGSHDLRGYAGSETETNLDVETYDLSLLEERFVEKCPEVLTVEKGAESEIDEVMFYNDFDYRYYFVPNNVVSMEHEDVSMIPLPWIFYGLAVVSLLVGFLWVGLAEGVLFGTIFGIAGYYSKHYFRPPEITINFQGGEERAFSLDLDDAEDLILDFRHRAEPEPPREVRQPAEAGDPSGTPHPTEDRN